MTPPQKLQSMIVDEKSKAIELIRSIQSGEGGNEERRALERATGIPNVWMIFDALELEGMSPDKIFNLICGNKEALGNHCA